MNLSTLNLNRFFLVLLMNILVHFFDWKQNIRICILRSMVILLVVLFSHAGMVQLLSPLNNTWRLLHNRIYSTELLLLLIHWNQKCMWTCPVKYRMLHLPFRIHKIKINQAIADDVNDNNNNNIIDIKHGKKILTTRTAVTIASSHSKKIVNGIQMVYIC